MSVVRVGGKIDSVFISKGELFVKNGTDFVNDFTKVFSRKRTKVCERLVSVVV